MNQDEFLIQHLTEGKKYADISLKYNIPRKTLTNWWDTGIKLRELIKKSNQTFNNKKKLAEFKYFAKAGKRAFFEWYRRQPRICGYCGIEESKLERIFAKEYGILSTKRGRGRSLELERKDSELNEYNEKNCILSCYVCNNHKSDLISEKDHQHFFTNSIRNYLESKYNELTQND